MSAAFQLTPQATEDLDGIGGSSRKGGRDAADRVEMEIVAACRRFARHPRTETVRHDLTSLPVRFWTVQRFPNYVLVYRPDTTPLRVIAVLHSKRDLRRMFPER